MGSCESQGGVEKVENIPPGRRRAELSPVTAKGPALFLTAEDTANGSLGS